MKSNKKIGQFILAVMAVAILSISSCTKNPDNPDNADSPTNPDDVFEFSTTVTHNLSLKYNVPTGYNVYFEVYTENPEQSNADGQVVKKNIDPIDVGFTDGQGYYSHKITVPSTVKNLYVYSPYAGVPRVLVSTVNEAGISEFSHPGENLSKAISFASDANYKDEDYNKLNALKRLGFWLNSNGMYNLDGRLYNLFGRPDYLSAEKIVVSSDILNLINQTIPEGRGDLVDPNLVKNGDIHVTENAHVDLFLIDETTSANSTLAYYCYPTNNPPKNESEIKDKIIVFPNTKVLKYHGYSPSGYNGAVERGEGVRLNYWKDGVDMGDEFPAGVSIGWIIYNQSYKNSSERNQKIDETAPRFFSDKNLNGNKKGHVVLFRSGDKVIFGFEDWPGDYDYNDVVFYIKSDPIQAITPDIPEIKPEEPSDSDIVASATYRGILSFEDLWPYRGDFDMNDMVVKYVSTVSYNRKNEVVKTKDHYIIISSGAATNNSFAYQLDARRSEVDVKFSSSIGTDGGAYLDQTMDRATIRLANNVLDYANEDNKRTFTVETSYIGRQIAKDDFTKPPYNPFITTISINQEVHLTNMRPTEKLDRELLGLGHDKSDPKSNKYYITYDEDGIQMPFAINISFENMEAMNTFVIPKERVRIDKFYPHFLNWIKTNGREDADWYLKPNAM